MGATQAALVADLVQLEISLSEVLVLAESPGGLDEQAGRRSFEHYNSLLRDVQRLAPGVADRHAPFSRNCWVGDGRGSALVVRADAVRALQRETRAVLNLVVCRRRSPWRWLRDTALGRSSTASSLVFWLTIVGFIVLVSSQSAG